MSEPIKVGDLVMYTRSCCMGFRDGINIFRVAAFQSPSYSPRYSCACCKADLPIEAYAAQAADESGAPLSWLKRIPPLSELEGEKRDEKLTEPA
jgi:hypothetical protein